MEGTEARPLTIRLHPDDNVVIARTSIGRGSEIVEERVVTIGDVPPGHKVATRPIAAGEPSVLIGG